jgi:16S rRNA (uracil1498-N3)-methyltransferase
MSLPRFVVERPVAPGESMELTGAEAKHARVRRLRSGDQVVVLDGSGWSALATIDLRRRAVAVRIVRVLPERAGESPLDLTLAVAVLKSDRFDWLIEKATELGVTRIRPFFSRYGLGHPSAARRRRWQQIALAATKQCGRTVPPEVQAPTELVTVVEELRGLRLLLAEHGEHPSLGERLPEHGDVQPISVIIGPEGGFSPEELDSARAASCHLVSLGLRILRAETAAITAAAICQLVVGDLG